MIWDNRSWKEEIVEVGSYTLHVSLRLYCRASKCYIIGVYATNCRMKREHVCEELGDVKSLFGGP